MKTVEAIIDSEWEESGIECARLSEPALAIDWNRKEEDAAWQYLQDARQ